MSSDAPPEFDLWVANWKTSFMPFATGGTQENPWLAELREKDPYEMFIHINTETAEEERDQGRRLGGGGIPVRKIERAGQS